MEEVGEISQDGGSSRRLYPGIRRLDLLCGSLAPHALMSCPGQETRANEPANTAEADGVDGMQAQSGLMLRGSVEGAASSVAVVGAGGQRASDDGRGRAVATPADALCPNSESPQIVWRLAYGAAHVWSCGTRPSRLRPYEEVIHACLICRAQRCGPVHSLPGVPLP